MSLLQGIAVLLSGTLYAAVINEFDIRTSAQQPGNPSIQVGQFSRWSFPYPRRLTDLSCIVIKSQKVN